MPEQTPGTPKDTSYKPPAPAGVASELTGDEPMPLDSVAAFGRWLTEKLGGSDTARAEVARQSGLPLPELASLMAGQRDYPWNKDHVQRIAAALVELRIVPHSDEVWRAAGFGSSDYLVPPQRVVQAMSQNA